MRIHFYCLLHAMLCVTSNALLLHVVPLSCHELVSLDSDNTVAASRSLERSSQKYSHSVSFFMF